MERTTGGDPVRDYLFNRTWFYDHLIDSESWDGCDYSSFSTNCSLLCGCSGLGSSDSAKESDIDPALAIGPFITTMNDLVGVWIYLTIAFHAGRRLALKIKPSFCCPSANFGRIFGYSG